MIDSLIFFSSVLAVAAIMTCLTTCLIRAAHYLTGENKKTKKSR